MTSGVTDITLKVLILIVMEERIGFLYLQLEEEVDGRLNPYCNGRKNRINLLKEI